MDAALGNDWASFLDQLCFTYHPTEIDRVLGLAPHAWGGVNHPSHLLRPVCSHPYGQLWAVEGQEHDYTSLYLPESLMQGRCLHLSIDPLWPLATVALFN